MSEASGRTSSCQEGVVDILSFGALLRRHREGAGLTQEELAEQAGVSVRAVSDLERGLRQAPRPSTVRLLAHALGLSPEDTMRLVGAAGQRPHALGHAERQPQRRHNLPRQLTSFVGRDRELAELRALLQTTPLLTLVGPGGVGKTRLALRLAEEVAATYEDGVWLVDLAPLSDPLLVPEAVAAAVGAWSRSGRLSPAALGAELGDRAVLLILDNGEHLVQACAELAEALLRTCPRLQILATSREPLGIGGELAWRVPSLALPDPRALPSAETLLEVGAIRLFAERARAARPSFGLTATNAAAVARICCTLDGIPLALELAAARIATVSPQQLAARLDDRFRLLTGGSRTAPPRQQTLRAMFDWSYGLLSDAERVLLERVAVFAGGWSLEAAETVCAGGPIAAQAVLDLLGRLVARSLVVVVSEADDPVRYRLLETVRQYAWERLVERGEDAWLRQRHCRYFLALAEEAHPHLPGGPHQTSWMERLEVERDNMRAAMRWCQEAGAVEDGLRLGGALWWFWFLRNSLADDAANWYEAIMRLGRSGARSAVRARALDGAGALASQFGELALARELHDESAGIWRERGDQEQLAASLNVQGWAALQRGDWKTARGLLEEALAAARSQGDVVQEAIILNNLGRALGEQGEDAAARHHHRLALVLFRDLSDRRGVALSLGWLSHWGLVGEDRQAAVSLGEEAVGLMRALAMQRNLGWTCIDLGVLQAAGDPGGARALLHEGLALAREYDKPRLLAWALDACAGVAVSAGRMERALRLGGKAAALRGAGQHRLERVQRELVGPWVVAARAGLDERAAATAWARGSAMAEDEALAEAFAAADELTARGLPARQSVAGLLTPRERQVANLVAQGHTNRQIARELVITERTVAHHVEHILAKVGAPSRAAVAAFVGRAGLATGVAHGQGCPGSAARLNG
jgi:predicted ATPase/DNA-binding CsgD family transcriptional regulator/DNA-binding XRE family transcriptional regulator